VGQAGFERRSALARDVLALVVLERGRRGGLLEAGPRAGGAAAALVAVGEPQQRADARIEPLALGELRARFGEVALLDERSSALEERLRRCLLVGLFVVGACGRRGEGRRERARQRRESSCNVLSRSPN
jgi:hypothetical protein